MFDSDFRKIEGEATVARGSLSGVTVADTPATATSFSSAEQPATPATIAGIEIPVSSTAQTGKKESDFKYQNFNITLVPGIAINSTDSDNLINSFNINLLFGKYAGVNGLELGAVNWDLHTVKGLQAGFICNYVLGSTTGFQASYFSNINLGEVKGFQASSFFNFSGDGITGFQNSGIFNYNREYFTGFQAAGIFNLNTGDFTGFQAAGILNYSSGQMNAAQAAGIGNVAIEDMEGFQAAGIVNVNTKHVSGFQLSGITNIALGGVKGLQASVINVSGDSEFAQLGVINVAGESSGLQLGVINVAEDISVPIGLFSYVKKGMLHFDIWGSDVTYANIGLKSGSKNIYGLLHGGVRPSDDGALFTVGGGIGGHIPLYSDILYLEIDLTSSSIHSSETKNWTTKMNLLTKGRIILGAQFLKHFGIFAGPTYNLFISDNHTGEDLASWVLEEHVHNGVNIAQWIGFAGGLQF